MTREEAIGLIKPIMFLMKNPQGEVWSDAYYALEMAIKALEEPKTGHWIENEKQTHVEKIYHCSECGFEAWGEWERTNYCPNCGSYNGG